MLEVNLERNGNNIVREVYNDKLISIKSYVKKLSSYEKSARVWFWFMICFER